MKKVEYESPRFEFQEMKLVERVAKQCWALHTAWYDKDGEGDVDADEVVSLDNVEGASGEGCASEDLLIKHFQKYFPGVTFPPKTFSPSVTNSTVVVPAPPIS